MPAIMSGALRAGLLARTGTRSLLSTARRTSWLAFHRGIDCVVRVMRSADRLRVGSHDLATAAVQTRLRWVTVESRGVTAAGLLAFRARSLNLTKYSASVSGRMPDLI